MSSGTQWDAYRALALQFTSIAVNRLKTRDEARAQMKQSIDRLAEEIVAGKGWVGSDLKLVVLPEYFLTGFPMGDTIEGWTDKAALEIDGPEYESLSAIAQKADLFLSGNAYEQDPNFPGMYFQTSFIIGPSGDVVLRYRRLISMYAPSPYDLLDRYLDIYGEDALMPVADTQIGKLACIASEEILYPELARCLALKGAEVFCHSSSEPGSPLPTPKNIAKQARAIENLAFVVSANSGRLTNYALGADSTDCHSKIVNHMGLVLVESAGGDSINAHAEVDLIALRRYRARPGMSNLLSRQPIDLYAREYAKTSIAAPNFLLDDEGAVMKPERKFFQERQAKVLDAMRGKGILRS